MMPEQSKRQIHPAQNAKVRKERPLKRGRMDKEGDIQDLSDTASEAATGGFIIASQGGLPPIVGSETFAEPMLAPTTNRSIRTKRQKGNVSAP